MSDQQNTTTEPYLLNQKAAYPTIETERLIRLLCKHFSRKVEVNWSATQGEVKFAEGVCNMKEEDGGVLSFCCEANNDEDLTAIVETINRHLSGFSSEDQVLLEWH